MPQVPQVEVQHAGAAQYATVEEQVHELSQVEGQQVCVAAQQGVEVWQHANETVLQQES